MLGKSGGAPFLIRARFIALSVVIAALASCASNVPQDKKSGEDARIKGAKPIILEENEGRAKGIVTYPGGDRVDWKLVEIPEKKRGSLNIKLEWTSPRPGLQLGFDVFTEWNEQIASSSKKSGKRARTKSTRGRRTLTVENARGKMYIRVYSLERGDAGQYRLTVEFKESLGAVAFDPLKLEIAEPPKLAAIPEHVDPCSEETFDPKKAECKNFCPSNGGPPGWKACKDVCPDPPKADIKACWATMPCPPGQPDENIRACKPKDWPPCPDLKNPDLRNPNCRVQLPPVIARITARVVEGSDTVLTIGAGANQNVTEAWTAIVIDGGSPGSPAISNGTVRITKIDKNRTTGRTKLSAGQIGASAHVKFTPPPMAK